jgi:hypothetical protein
MPTEIEPIAAEKMRKGKFVALLGTCHDCTQPVTEGQEFLRSDNGIQHALCFYDPAFARHVCELKSNTGQ